MHCIKCGRDVPDNTVFCPHCLEGMDRYPIKPGTPVNLPVRNNTVPDRKPSRHRRQKTPAEQLLRMKRLVRSLCVLLLVFALALGATVFFLVRSGLIFPDEPETGRNYVVDTTQNP